MARGVATFFQVIAWLFFFAGVGGALVIALLGFGLAGPDGIIGLPFALMVFCGCLVNAGLLYAISAFFDSIGCVERNTRSQAPRYFEIDKNADLDWTV